jgi:transposase InsO family protein
MSASTNSRPMHFIAELGIRHLLTRPRRPRTNAKAERVIQTCNANGPTARCTRTHGNDDEHSRPWLDYYNNRRPHSAFSHWTPASLND